VLTSFVTGLSSPSHLVKMVKEGDYTIVTLAEEVSRLDRDFILEISSERRQEPFCILASNDIGDRAALFRFFPDLDEIARGKESRSEVIFVLDCSGSMSGSSIEEAKKALELSLRSLSENDLFNIIRFGSRFELFSENQVAYDGATLNRALKYVHGIHADLGGTELGPAMSHVCSMRKNEGFQRDVLLLTDGEVANTREIISMIAAAKDRMRVFTFGIGYGASHALVKGAARAGRGAWEMIQPGEKIQPKVLRQFSRICQPSLTDVSVTFTGMNAELPRILPPLFEGDSCTLFVRVLDARPDAAVTFTGTCLGRTHSWKAGVGEEVRDDTVPCLWALSRIRELENEDPSDPSTGGSNQLSRRMKGIEKEITDLGLRFNLLTRLTSFVAVEERKGDEKSRGRPEYRRVPVQLTRDWHGIGMGQEIQAGFQTLEMRRTTMHKYITFGKSKRFFGREITLAKERPIMQTTSREHSTSAENVKTEWCLELLDTQQAEGYFTGLNVVAERLNMERRHLTELGDTLDIPDDLLDKNLGRKIIVTLLAVHVLEADPDAKSASGRAIGKAKRWLRRQIALFTAGGAVPQDADFGSTLRAGEKPLRDHLKERFAISL
jgi:uncharacterized protein YegL